MPDLISQRDQARQELFDTIDSFAQEVNSLPLQEREQSLQVCTFSRYLSPYCKC